MTGPARPDVLIVGGGIGGLATALAVAATGRRAHVVEQASEFAEIGAGIQLAPNAMRMLERLGVVNRVRQDCFYPQGALLMNALTGDRITALTFDDRFRLAFGQPYVVTHRHDLLDALLQGCVEAPGITLETSKRVDHLDQVGDELLVRCADGSTYRPKSVVGADGLWSTVRQFVLGDGPPKCRQHVAYRGTIPIDSVANAAGVDNVVWWIGPRIHLIQYPIRRGELYNQVAVFESDQYVPDSDNWGLVDELETRFRSVAAPVAEGVAKINRDRRWALFDRDPIENWTSGRVTLLGDAAHPMLQYLAQGAAQALEDAAALGCALEICDSYEAAFSRYQADRLPRTSSLQIWARRMGEIVHFDGVGAILRDELLRSRAEDDFRYFEWLYSYGGDDLARA